MSSPGSTAFANGRQSQPTYQQIVGLLEKNPNTGKPPKSIDEWLPLLPLELRSNFTFVYQSRSPHGELGDKSVDKLHPRLVLFTQDGKVTVALGGNPEAPRYNTVELIQYIDGEARFEFSEFVLSQAETTRPENGKPNPPACLRCHGHDPRPVTDSYPLWPGFYGSVRDTFPTNSPELQWYREFLAKGKDTGPYRFLIWPKGTSVPPYLDPDDYSDQSKEGSVEGLKLLPNTRLGMAWTELNRKRIQRKLETSPRYRDYRFGLLAGLLGCRPLPVTQQHVQKMYELLSLENADRLQRLGYLPAGPEKKTLDMMELGLAQNMAEIDYLAQCLELDRSDWSLAYENPSLSFFDGILSSLYQKKNYYLKEDFILEMLRQISKEDASFRPYFRTYMAYESVGYPFGERLDFSAALRAGRLLQAKEMEIEVSLPELTPTADSRRLPDAGILMTNGNRIPFQRCSHCHEGTLSLTSGTKIPFDSPTQLKAALNSKSRSGRSLYDEIVVRISSRGPEQMPPSEEPFSPAEVGSLTNYLISVLKE